MLHAWWHWLDLWPRSFAEVSDRLFTHLCTPMNATLRHLTRTGYAAPCGLRALQHDHNASTRARLYRSARRTAIMPAAANGAIVPPSVRTLAPPSVRGRGGRPGPKMPLVQHARLADTEVLKLKTPHSGFHLDSDREFMEGWYWRVALPDGDSFALMYSYEHRPDLPEIAQDCVAVQVMGPGDGYIAQASTDLGRFWGDRNDLQLGACLKPAPARRHGKVPMEMVPEAVFNELVAEGFQASATWQQGTIRHAPGTIPGHIPAAVDCAKWAFNIRPVYGWGNSGRPQQSTASWLSVLPVFEPHWQVLMSHGIADGYLQWGSGKESMIHFRDCPAYAEKNWGAGFPRKWAWLQCNSFPSHPHLAVTAVAAVRNLFNSPGVEEDVGLIGVHHEGRFYDLGVTWGRMRWSVDPWGKWHMWAKSDKFEVLVEAECGQDVGTRLRAPTPEGLQPMCKDTFKGRLRLRLWKLDRTGVRGAEAFVDATSESAAAETGGGPWWDSWNKEAKMNDLVSLAVRFPVDTTLSQIEENSPVQLPSILKPPGY